jgi:hypothetical protein
VTRHILRRVTVTVHIQACSIDGAASRAAPGGDIPQDVPASFAGGGLSGAATDWLPAGASRDGPSPACWSKLNTDGGASPTMSPWSGLMST